MNILSAAFLVIVAIVFFGVTMNTMVLADGFCSRNQEKEPRMSHWTDHDSYRPRQCAAPVRRHPEKKHEVTFPISNDLQEFTPEQISVKVVEGHVVVLAEHNDNSDSLNTHRRFMKSYSLPPGIDAKDVRSTLSHNGVLTISIIRKEIPTESETVIPVHVEPSET